jgi:hypothetical protein
MTMTTFSQKISPQIKSSAANYWKGLLTAKITFPTKTFPQTKKPATDYGKVGLYIANFVFGLFLIRYGKFFSDAFTIPSSIFVIGVFLFAGFTRLRRLDDGSRVKAYIKGHEALVLILLGIFLIAGTVFYVALTS